MSAKRPECASSGARGVKVSSVSPVEDRESVAGSTGRLFVPEDPFFGAAPEPSTIEEGLTEARLIIASAVAQHGPICRSFLLLSGGNDSMVLLDACSSDADSIVHINTGIGVPATNEFVRWVVGVMGRELIEMHPPIPYRDLVLGRWKGFPGPGGHRFPYTMLKERCVEQLLRDHRSRRGDRFILLTGARAGESRRRMGTAEPVRRVGGQVWVNPLLRWSNDLMAEYRATRGLPVNEVTKHLHMSGECLCGAFAKPGELEEIRFFYPDVAAQIEGLEAEVRAAGIRRCRWGIEGPRLNDPAPGPMCSSCTLWDSQVGGEVEHGN